MTHLPQTELILEPLFYLIIEEVREVRGVVGREGDALWYTPLDEPDSLRQMPLQGAIDATDGGEWTMTLDLEQAQWWARLFGGPQGEGAA